MDNPPCSTNLQECDSGATAQKAYVRITAALAAISGAKSTALDVVLVVGHAVTVDAAARWMQAKKPSTVDATRLNKIAVFYPFASTVTGVVPQTKPSDTPSFIADALPLFHASGFHNHADLR